MAYKILGFVVWRGGRWYLRRRMEPIRRKAAIALLAGLVIGGVIAAQRQQRANHS